MGLSPEPVQLRSSNRVHDFDLTPHPAAGLPSRIFTSTPCLDSLKKLCSQTTSQATYPLVSSIIHNVPVYYLPDLSSVHHVLSNPKLLSNLQDEWHHILLSGPGVLVLKGMFTDCSVISSTNDAFEQIVARERATSEGKGDHFGTAGTNTRIWNSLQKHCIADPESFVQYYSNPWLAAICEAWLGPAFRVTAQANIVHPGGKAQTSHRDYHLGFQSAEVTNRFPKAIQVASQFLTLQGAVAHSNMPAASGPTRFLPFSQMFEEGFLAYRLPEFQNWFEQRWVALDLEIGDAVFFNPALFHAAGENKMADFDRKANLLQISSAFGKTMENLDTFNMISACWEELIKKFESEGQGEGIECLVKALAEGYPFPTNLDRRVPGPGGMAPSSEQDLVKHGLHEHWAKEHILEELRILRMESAA
ncbi:phytanoyl-CoA dioxygenase family protein [Viridothelium virens]|uniref:Phytanoyl-CoA dioxygenase family protein n=1 Tax=Viridothelium virens TaxID=1048519 RepID=A0A6A6H1U0_VIRVR|nr:phytanoyl-CoA dioxygenase family protein [Viridothelium virens]